MATTARPGARVEITAVQSYEATWDDALDRLIGLTGVLIAVNDSHLRENERTGTLDCAPFEVRIDRDAEIEAGQIVFAADVRPVDTSALESATDQTERRDRVRRAICEAEGFAWDPDMLEPDEYGDVADAVLRRAAASVLSEPADQAAVRAAALQEAADGSGREAEAELYVLLRKSGEDRHEAQALIDRHRDEVLRRAELRRLADEAQGTTPTTDPIPLRWGLDDIEHVDDDTTTVLLSGPDGRPYWLELNPERANALREALADPEKAQQP